MINYPGGVVIALDVASTLVILTQATLLAWWALVAAPHRRLTFRTRYMTITACIAAVAVLYGIGGHDASSTFTFALLTAICGVLTPVFFPAPAADPDDETPTAGMPPTLKRDPWR